MKLFCGFSQNENRYAVSVGTVPLVDTMALHRVTDAGDFSNVQSVAIFTTRAKKVAFVWWTSPDATSAKRVVSRSASRSTCAEKVYVSEL